MPDIHPAIYTLLGTAIGGLIGYLNAVKVSDRKEMQKAAIDFHEAFLDALMSLDQRYYCRENPDPDENRIGKVYYILNRTFPQQIKAMLRFRLYLPADKREKFDEAWKEYCRYDVDGEPEYPFLEKYFENRWEGRDTREYALENISRLLNFVETVHKSPFETEMNG
ncbi:hypothetical protein SAMN02745119_01567 [Trichlorobacter thiogenes]|uniref:Uncharacterized protein n=1 Tax=Trichlorobacter thiogenes TaxID=115783 RepID=A0A1T4NC92_9BACT|nr:hypothetical protein [Trichlorobacter thiogenes]SJZ76834.1 hypothetical protein SAMN02745119_01567 [Trichlorobacter thiogenes]